MFKLLLFLILFIKIIIYFICDDVFHFESSLIQNFVPWDKVCKGNQRIKLSQGKNSTWQRDPGITPKHNEKSKSFPGATWKGENGASG